MTKRTCVYLFQAQRILKTTETTELTEDYNCKYNVTEVESPTSSLRKTWRNDSFNQFEIIWKTPMVPMAQARKDPNNEIIYCDSCNVMTITDCCLSKVQMSLSFKTVKHKYYSILSQCLMYSRMALTKQFKIARKKSHLQKVFWRKKLKCSIYKVIWGF